MDKMEYTLFHELGRLHQDLTIARNKLDVLPKHRSLSLAITKVEEAMMWIRDRIQKEE